MMLANLLAETPGMSYGPTGGEMILIGGIALVALVVVLFALAVWLWALVDVCSNRSLDRTTRRLWFIGVLLTITLGAALYLAFGRSRVSVDQPAG